MGAGTYILVLIFGLSGNYFAGDPRSTVTTMDSQHFEGFTSLESCEAGAKELGPALAQEYNQVLGDPRMAVSYRAICVNAPGGKRMLNPAVMQSLVR